MKVQKVFNDYLVIEELQEEKKDSPIILIDKVEPLQKGKVLMIPDDFDTDSAGIDVGSIVLFYTGTGIPAGDNYIIHVQNIAVAIHDK